MKRSYFRIFVLLLSCLSLFSSCKSVKQLTLFQKNAVTDPDTIGYTKAFPSAIQPGDILSVTVNSLSATATSFFNPYQGAGGAAAGGAINSQEAPGYLVDQAGQIDLPLIGSIKLAGLTTREAKNLVKDSLKKFLREPTVTLRIVNYRVTFLGEFNNIGVFNIPNERVSLPEALGLAGDLTTYARRDNILVIREVDGKKQFGHVNLNSRDVFNSPYYYLRSNDLVYAEPSAGKAVQNNSFFRIFPIVAGVITLAIALFTQVL
ncbi:polysaccharide biosynthesis/export family protein [Mucilaginibacter sp. PAMB04274]|uniref:polysaccharide biosynthesis/export family protein n=1 Tax=Mucilaginibacter sp. PAMB04274 TaxID=3138568 RepID=UPI0031F62F1B